MDKNGTGTSIMELGVKGKEGRTNRPILGNQVYMSHVVPYVTAVVSKLCGNGQSLIQGHSYPLVGLGNSYFHIIDEIKDPVLYPKSYFLEQHQVPPNNWITENDDEGEYWSCPIDLSADGLFEDYHDGKQEAVDIVNSFVQKISPRQVDVGGDSDYFVP